MDILTAAARVRRILPTAEQRIDAALASFAELMATCAEASLESGVPPSEAHEALLRLHKLQGQALTARGDLLRFHSKVREIGREYAGPDEGECPPVEPKGLKVIESSKAA